MAGCGSNGRVPPLFCFLSLSPSLSCTATMAAAAISDICKVLGEMFHTYWYFVGFWRYFIDWFRRRLVDQDSDFLAVDCLAVSIVNRENCPFFFSTFEMYPICSKRKMKTISKNNETFSFFFFFFFSIIKIKSK